MPDVDHRNARASLRLSAVCAIALLCIGADIAPSRGASDWPVFGHDSARSGVDTGQSTLSGRSFGRLRLRWQIKLGDVADSTPILLSHVSVNGELRAMLFQTARNGETYGIDAFTGAIVWRFATHGPNITTSTPAADPSGLWIYAPGVDGFVHKLDVAGGAEVRGGGFPARITRMAESEKNASALNVANGYLYAVTSGYFGDSPPYVGHVVAVRLSDGETHVFDTLCSDQHALPMASSCSRSGSGIWSRAGAVVDPDPAMHGRIYVATGNGNYGTGDAGHDYGDSVLVLSSDATQLAGSYTPRNYADLDSGDIDLGSTAPALLLREKASTTPLMLVQGGKDSILRLLDRAHLPGVGGELQRVDIGSRLFSSPATWSDSSHRTWVFLGLADGVQAFRLATDSRGTSRLVDMWHAKVGETQEGTSPVVSNGIVFVAMNGAIYALDARTGRDLWHSSGATSGGTIGAVHWQSPIAANNWIYCSDESGELSAFALLPRSIGDAGLSPTAGSTVPM